MNGGHISRLQKFLRYCKILLFAALVGVVVVMVIPKTFDHVPMGAHVHLMDISYRALRGANNDTLRTTVRFKW